MSRLAVAVLIGLVAYVTADTCDDLTALKVKAQWARAYSHGHSREHFAEAVWRAAFNLSPAVRERLHAKGADDINSGKFRAFAVATLAGVDLAVEFLDHPEELKAELSHAHSEQLKRKIPDELIDIYVKALGHVVPAQLGRCWDREAWKACFHVITEGIKGH